jgi:hypothetical protein
MEQERVFQIVADILLLCRSMGCLWARKLENCEERRPAGRRFPKILCA